MHVLSTPPAFVLSQDQTLHNTLWNRRFGSSYLLFRNYFDFSDPSSLQRCDPHIHLVCYSVFKVPCRFRRLNSNSTKKRGCQPPFFIFCFRVKCKSNFPFSGDKWNLLFHKDFINQTLSVIIILCAHGGKGCTHEMQTVILGRQENHSIGHRKPTVQNNHCAPVRKTPQHHCQRKTPTPYL